MNRNGIHPRGISYSSSGAPIYSDERARELAESGFSPSDKGPGANDGCTNQGGCTGLNFGCSNTGNCDLTTNKGSCSGASVELPPLGP